ncbi:MAG: ATP-binding protein [bacterium]
MSIGRILEGLQKYRFEFRHLTVLFLVLLIFQFVLSFIQKSSLRSFLDETQRWYQQFSAENVANITSTSLELLLENINLNEIKTQGEKEKIIQSFNIIFSQQLLQQNVEDLCLIVEKDNKNFPIDDGALLFDYLTHNFQNLGEIPDKHKRAIQLYDSLQNKISSEEQIHSILEGIQTFHIFVPFVPRGEYLGVLYMQKTPDLANITGEILASYDEAAIIYSSLILLGLLAMYYISSFTVKERNEAQKLLYDENEKRLKEQIIHEKESLFTKRIYHTHHKAEKVMGFIKEDLRNITASNIDEIRYKVTKYSNFISRVIYDMKWYDPPLQTIRNPIFETDLNEVLQFIVKYIFLRISSSTEIFEFNTELDEKLPRVNINEFVVWEILEPLIQNSIDHGRVEKIKIIIKTEYDDSKKQSQIIISDNGVGIRSDLLEIDSTGLKKIFSENVSTKINVNSDSGYGCYIAYEIATKRCGWSLNAFNNPEKGCSFIITIPN